jgi:hypothetical protein
LLRRSSLLCAALTACATLSACERRDAGTPVTDASAQAAAQQAAQAAHVQEVVAAGGVVDSILPIAEHVQRFRAGMTPVDTLRHASASIAALVTRLTTALATRDTADLNAMVLDRAEFAYLVYPASPMSKPPYEAPPELLWGQIIASSDEGAKQLLSRLGGAAVTAHDLHCPTIPDTAAVRLYERCTVRFSAPGRAPLKGNLFGSIVAQGHRYKFLGLANRI